MLKKVKILIVFRFILKYFIQLMINLRKFHGELAEFHGRLAEFHGRLAEEEGKSNI